MGKLVTTAQDDLVVRRAHLLRLRFELVRLGVAVRVRRARQGRLRLRIRHSGWSETVLCAGADDAFAFVTAHGRLLGPAEDARVVARLLVWMAERRQR
ncbi:hypothetical protein [Actinomadura xylanilytica]|uniref:hypothetical protein n=1 Tax=Actinomadura xylanilytica TaxID=887459 RepID=UPI00255AEDA1|nr:hypothetical protein [Actinomadura xylanilytica]MDL4770709.1 hypothetical protein [Actinomadura xylanilytica]